MPLNKLALPAPVVIPEVYAEDHYAAVMIARDHAEITLRRLQKDFYDARPYVESEDEDEESYDTFLDAGCELPF